MGNEGEDEDDFNGQPEFDVADRDEDFRGQHRAEVADGDKEASRLEGRGDMERFSCGRPLHISASQAAAATATPTQLVARGARYSLTRLRVHEVWGVFIVQTHRVPTLRLEGKMQE
jgi:hypothetical protein